MYKSELLKLYKDVHLSASHLRYLLNVKYYEILEPLGYEKQQKFIPPIVLKKFFELFGEPEINLN